MIFFVFITIVVCVILGGIILIQNPKGGGLAGNVGGFSNQLMGVKQTTDVLEKGTWVMAIVMGLLCLLSAAFIPKAGRINGPAPEKVNAQQNVPQQRSAQPSAPYPGTQPTGH